MTAAVAGQVVADQLKAAQDLDNGRELIYPGDEWLPKPIVYANPHEINTRFKVFTDEMPPGADSRTWRPRRFVPEQFVNGKYVAYTRIQNEAVRRLLGRHADRWSGEDLKRDRVCPHESCRFTTRNEAAYEDHESYTKRHYQPVDFHPFKFS